MVESSERGLPSDDGYSAPSHSASGAAPQVPPQAAAEFEPWAQHLIDDLCALVAMDAPAIIRFTAAVTPLILEFQSASGGTRPNAMAACRRVLVNCLEPRFFAVLISLATDRSKGSNAAMEYLQATIEEIARITLCRKVPACELQQAISTAIGWVWQKLGKYDPLRPFPPWCAVVIRRKCISDWRNGKRWRGREALTGAETDPRPKVVRTILESALDAKAPFSAVDSVRLEQWSPPMRAITLAVALLWPRVPGEVQQRWLEEAGISWSFPPAECSGDIKQSERIRLVADDLGISEASAKMASSRGRSRLTTLDAVRGVAPRFPAGVMEKLRLWPAYDRLVVLSMHEISYQVPPGEWREWLRECGAPVRFPPDDLVLTKKLRKKLSHFGGQVGVPPAALECGAELDAWGEWLRCQGVEMTFPPTSLLAERNAGKRLTLVAQELAIDDEAARRIWQMRQAEWMALLPSKTVRSADDEDEP